MNTLTSTALRVMRQLRHDHRSVAMMLLLPSALMGLLSWILSGKTGAFDSLGPQLLGMFPLVIMFVITAVTMLRERTSGTLERLMTTPMPKASLIGGYAVAFGAFAVAQAVVATCTAVYAYGMDDHGNAPYIMLVAVCDALLGTAMGLAVSSLATTEFQAVQFMPVTLFPQLLLCGIVSPRDALPDVLRLASKAMPLSYAIDALAALGPAGAGANFWPSVGVIVVFLAACLGIGAATLHRRTT